MAMRTSLPTSATIMKQRVRTYDYPIATAVTTRATTLLLQICFLICTTVLTLSSPTHAYPLVYRVVETGSSDDSTSGNNNDSLSTAEDKYGSLILDVGQKTVISTSNWILGILLIIVGLVQVFYGFKFIRITLVITGFISWAVIAMMIMVVLRWDRVYFLFKPSHGPFWIWFIPAILGAILSFRYWDLGVAFAGGFGGFALAMGIIAAINDSHNITNVSRYILLACLILIGAAIAIFYERFSIILGTSFGGAFMFMFGVDEFLQAGYREMIVIFDIAGRTLQYRPDRNVFIMIGCSLALSLLGIGWEFWHHAKPLLVDRKALFRIYGRPFGKRPKKLAGQRLKHKVAQSDWYSYLAGCVCLKRRTAEEVLYGDDEGYDETQVAAGVGTTITTATAITTTTVTTTGESSDNKTGPSTNSDNAQETVVIIVEENVQDEKLDGKPAEIVLLPGTDVNYGSGIESTIHSGSSSSAHSTITVASPIQVLTTETSESFDGAGARIITTTTTTTTGSSEEVLEQHQQQYHSSEATWVRSESTSCQNTSESSHSETLRTELLTSSKSAQEMITSTISSSSMETNSISRTLLQSMAVHHSSSSRTATTTTISSSTTTNTSGTTVTFSSS
ncbi:hypothetical protein FBU30_002973 [Linnemannia zychae]|nr:hypothetical protein FBU30_002973 [Linnemannia zychae]